MFELTLKRSDGKFVNLKMFESAKELTLAQKLDFDYSQFGIISFLKKHEDKLFESRAGYLMLIAKGISSIFDVDLSDILNLEGRSILEITEDDVIEFLQSVSGQQKEFKKGQLERSLLKIWNYITSIVNSVDSEIPDKITFKGTEYDLPKTDKHPVSGRIIYKSITTKQAIEVIQLNNNYHSWSSKNPHLSNTQTDVQWLYTKYLSEVSLLLTPIGSDENYIPLDEDEYSVFMAEKMNHFADIDWQTVYWIELWFNNYMKELKKDKENEYFFSSTFKPTTKEELEAEQKAIQKGREIHENVGIKNIIPTLIEIDPFSKQGMSKYWSVMRSKFTNAVKIISTHNARG